MYLLLNLSAIIRISASSTKVFLQLRHLIELLLPMQNQYQGLLYLKMFLLALNVHILPMRLLGSLWKAVNNSKSYVLTVPMTMSFKDLKNFSCGKISFFLFACLWSEDFKLEKLINCFSEILTRAKLGLIEKGSWFPEKCWFVAGIWFI